MPSARAVRLLQCGSPGGARQLADAPRQDRVQHSDHRGGNAPQKYAIGRKKKSCQRQQRITIEKEISSTRSQQPASALPRAARRGLGRSCVGAADTHRATSSPLASERHLTITLEQLRVPALVPSKVFSGWKRCVDQPSLRTSWDRSDFLERLGDRALVMGRASSPMPVTRSTRVRQADRGDSGRAAQHAFGLPIIQDSVELVLGTQVTSIMR